ncbi:hypothetical protein N9Z18_00150 [Verrucomicrobiales bacterium]|nr:hypothetical protein [Verrucomicrobiales bacterium]
MENKGSSFLKGEAGCFAVFALLALLALISGGSVRMDFGGVVILFVIGGVIGGVIGLLVNWIYQKGKGDASDDS